MSDELNNQLDEQPKEQTEPATEMTETPEATETTEATEPETTETETTETEPEGTEATETTETETTETEEAEPASEECGVLSYMGKNGGKTKKERKKLTPEQKKKRTIKALIITGAVVLVLAIFFSGIAIGNAVGAKALIKQAKTVTKVVYDQHPQLTPKFDEEWAYFECPDDRDFKVLQFTDVHIGGGSFSQQKDAWAMNAVETMIRQEQPDLVVITGDIAYPVPFQAGTFNNLNATKIFANLMESLGVYWTFAFGNHDTEAYSMYSRKDITEYYEQSNFKYCLYQRGFADEEDKFGKIDRGFGNHIINVKNSAGKYIQSIVMLDSHSYIDGDYFGVAWKYDNLHQSQVDWYAQEMEKLKEANGDGEYVKNMAFFHIPLVEYRQAWKAIRDAYGHGDYKGTLQPDFTAPIDEYKEGGLTRPAGVVTYYYGQKGESASSKNKIENYGVFCGYNNDSFFETGVEHGLQGTFCGHDHYNNFSVEYMGVRLTYGMSVDYLAYPGIYKEHSQRGCTVINIDGSGNMAITPKNYYSNYNVKYEKG